MERLPPSAQASPDGNDEAAGRQRIEREGGSAGRLRLPSQTTGELGTRRADSEIDRGGEGRREGRGPWWGGWGTEQRCPLPAVGDPTPTPAGAGRPEPAARGGVRTPGATAPGRGGGAGCEGGGGQLRGQKQETLSPRGSLTAGLAGVPALGQTRPQMDRQARSPRVRSVPQGRNPGAGAPRSSAGATG